MVKLQSMTSGSHYVIKLRGVSQSKSTLSQWQRAANHVFCSFTGVSLTPSPFPRRKGVLVSTFSECVPLASQNQEAA